MNLHNQAVQLIQVRMKEIGMTQTELAKRMGWTPKHVNRILNGFAEPSMASLDFMAFILGIDLEVTAKVPGEWGTLITPGER